MSYQNVFKRYELKYLLTAEQKDILREHISGYLQPDSYGRSTICNIYYDTPDYLLIRNSIERPVYKEKLRLRSYGTAAPDSIVFAELKKKYQDVVYKRRISAPEQAAVNYLAGGEKTEESQISREIDSFMKFYGQPSPKMFISYEREAFFSKDDPGLRVTFDENILWRQEDLSLCSGPYGQPVLGRGMTLMEIKTGAAIPLWLARELSQGKIYKTSFSKYGNAYKAAMTAKTSGGICYV